PEATDSPLGGQRATASVGAVSPSVGALGRDQEAAADRDDGSGDGSAHRGTAGQGLDDEQHPRRQDDAGGGGGALRGAEPGHGLNLLHFLRDRGKSVLPTMSLADGIGTRARLLADGLSGGGFARTDDRAVPAGLAGEDHVAS